MPLSLARLLNAGRARSPLAWRAPARVSRRSSAFTEARDLPFSGANMVAEHAALEQACSGWVRTGLGLVGLGLGVEAIAIIKDSAVDDALEREGAQLEHQDVKLERASVLKHYLKDPIHSIVAFQTMTAGFAVVSAASFRYFKSLERLGRGVHRPGTAMPAGLAFIGVYGCATLLGLIPHHDLRPEGGSHRAELTRAFWLLVEDPLFILRGPRPSAIAAAHEQH